VSDIATPVQIRQKVQRTLREAYAIKGSLERLPGENLNFLVQADDGRRFIAKIAGREVPPEVVAMEFAALRHAVNKGTTLQLPEIVANKHGELETRIKIRMSDYNRLRILKYVEGNDLSDISDISDELRQDLGKRLAEFDLIMADFDHPAAHRNHRWDLARAVQHEFGAELVEDPERRKVLHWAFGQLANRFSCITGRVRWQFIHGDANPENVRVEGGRVVGLIDFGDSCYNPIVCDLAISLAYQMMDQKYPFDVAERIIVAFESVLPLLAEERAVLLPLVCARLSVTVSVAAERRKIDPGNDNWFVSEGPAWRLLMQLYASGKSQFFSS